MDLKIIIEQLTVLFFIMAIGFLINKLGILNKEYNKCISKLLLTIGIPGLLISSVANGNPFENNYDIFNVLYVLFCQRCYSKLNTLKRQVLKCCENLKHNQYKHNSIPILTKNVFRYI